MRVVSPGESFGELALLQPHNLRTASVLAENRPAEQLQAPDASDNPAPTPPGVDLIQIPRSLFDAATTGAQASQLEQRLQLLAAVPVRGRPGTASIAQAPGGAMPVRP